MGYEVADLFWLSFMAFRVSPCKYSKETAITGEILLSVVPCLQGFSQL
jgi:hypothetical protein